MVNRKCVICERKIASEQLTRTSTVKGRLAVQLYLLAAAGRFNLARARTIYSLCTEGVRGKFICDDESLLMVGAPLRIFFENKVQVITIGQVPLR